MAQESLPQFLLVIDGPSCGGKSSVADVIHGGHPRIFLARRDRIKWLISDYRSGAYSRELGEMLSLLMDAALRSGLSVIKEGLDDRESLERLAETHGVPVHYANVSAPEDVLAERFAERVAAKRAGKQVSNADPVRFQDLRRNYEASKASTPLEFDSSRSTPQEIASVILERLRATAASASP